MGEGDAMSHPTAVSQLLRATAHAIVSIEMQERESTRSGQSKNRRILAQCHETRAVDDGAIDGDVAILHHAHVGEVVGAEVEVTSCSPCVPSKESSI